MGCAGEVTVKEKEGFVGRAMGGGREARGLGEEVGEDGGRTGATEEEEEGAPWGGVKRNDEAGAAERMLDVAGWGRASTTTAGVGEGAGRFVLLAAALGGGGGAASESSSESLTSITSTFFVGGAFAGPPLAVCFFLGGIEPAAAAVGGAATTGGGEGAEEAGEDARRTRLASWRYSCRVGPVSGNARLAEVRGGGRTGGMDRSSSSKGEILAAAAWVPARVDAVLRAVEEVPYRMGIRMLMTSYKRKRREIVQREVLACSAGPERLHRRCCRTGSGWPREQVSAGRERKDQQGGSDVGAGELTGLVSSTSRMTPNMRSAARVGGCFFGGEGEGVSAIVSASAPVPPSSRKGRETAPALLTCHSGDGLTGVETTLGLGVTIAATLGTTAGDGMANEPVGADFFMPAGGPSLSSSSSVLLRLPSATLDLSSDSGVDTGKAPSD